MSTSKHPKGLYLVFATSTAERFSYYGMRAIFILFLTQALLFDKEHAASIYGSYTGLVYLTPLIGGYIADKYWGIRRSVFWGAMMMAVGQFLMFFSASILDTKELSHWLMYGGLTFIILGNGCFKPTVTSLVGQLYKPGDRRLDSAYTIFYMGVNIGSLFAPLVCGYFGETGNPHDFKWGFLIAAIFTLFTIVIFETQKNKYLVDPDGKQLGIIPDTKKEQPKVEKTTQQTKVDNSRKKRNYLLLGMLAIALAIFFYWCFGDDWISIGIFTACIVFPVSILLEGSLTKIERSRIFVIYIIAFFVIFFWAAYEQAGASLTLFAAEQTDRFVLGGEVPASWIQSFNPFFVVALTPVSLAIFGFLAKKGKEPSAPRKIGLGMLIAACGFGIMAFGSMGLPTPDALAQGADVSLVSPNLLISTYLVLTFAELLLSPMGISFVSKVAPPKYKGMMMGGWFVATAIGNYMVSIIGYLWGGIELWMVWSVLIVLCLLSALFIFSIMKKLEKVA